MKKIYTVPDFKIEGIPAADIVTLSVASYGDNIDSVDFSDF